MWTKLRPCVREFLAAVHAIAEVYIYTHGNKDYAAAMASILDPERLFFKERIISQAGAYIFIICIDISCNGDSTCGRG